MVLKANRKFILTLAPSLISIDKVGQVWVVDIILLPCCSFGNRLVYARDDAAMRVGAQGPEYTVMEVNDHYSKDIYR